MIRFDTTLPGLCSPGHQPTSRAQHQPLRSLGCRLAVNGSRAATTANSLTARDASESPVANLVQLLQSERGAPDYLMLDFDVDSIRSRPQLACAEVVAVFAAFDLEA